MEEVWSSTITTIINGIVTGTGGMVTFLVVMQLLIQTYAILNRRDPAPSVLDEDV
jgi:hypothetical protein